MTTRPISNRQRTGQSIYKSYAPKANEMVTIIKAAQFKWGGIIMWTSLSSTPKSCDHTKFIGTLLCSKKNSDFKDVNFNFHVQVPYKEVKHFNDIYLWAIYLHRKVFHM